MALDKPHWLHLFKEVVTSGLCTGCAGCVIACPHDVLRYDDSNGVYKPFKIEADGGFDNCTHGEKGCTMCTRACPRFRTWEEECDNYLFGRQRTIEEVAGVSSEIILARASDPEINKMGQDGGLVSALLIWALENDIVDAALLSYTPNSAATPHADNIPPPDIRTHYLPNTDSAGSFAGRSQKAIPLVAHNRRDVLKAIGSRYTYSTNPLGYFEAVQDGAERLALVGMGCQSSAPAIMSARKAGKVARRFVLNIGLLCSKTFDETVFPQFFEQRYKVKEEQISKINIKGVFQVWTTDGSYQEIPLKEAYAWTRDGCKACPDFAAQHADISAGGIGTFENWTLLIIRTQTGRQTIDGAVTAGMIETRPVDDDPNALKTLNKLSRISRKRWPADAITGPGLI
ncbi:MAG: Coenzyme F420 hydrogenase/dehydrogenase, beta subunit C-terminal domain [Actinobacteria bacterium]|nr:Coenzyme F420 hydrogenase/dehydrogenase, beta subunit C-terminal domain [Actinomycetota bacterium]MCL6104740.1 Coenzyme F420 hydrogenase/dehydrogenase, beta subunit C-terminal domain [Actinomycetota bacterium]